MNGRASKRIRLHARALSKPANYRRTIKNLKKIYRNSRARAVLFKTSHAEFFAEMHEEVGRG